MSHGEHKLARDELISPFESNATVIPTINPKLECIDSVDMNDLRMPEINIKMEASDEPMNEDETEHNGMVDEGSMDGNETEDDPTYTDSELANMSGYHACIAAFGLDHFACTKFQQLVKVCKTRNFILELKTSNNQKSMTVRVPSHELWEICLMPGLTDEKKDGPLYFYVNDEKRSIIVNNIQLAYEYCSLLFDNHEIKVFVDLKNSSGFWTVGKCKSLIITNSSNKPATKADVERIVIGFREVTEIVFLIKVSFHTATFCKIISPQYLMFTTAEWITSGDLVRFTSKEVHIGKNNLRDAEINYFLKEWKMSKRGAMNIKQLSINYTRKPSNMLWNELDVIQMNKTGFIEKLPNMKFKSPNPIDPDTVDLNGKIMGVTDGKKAATVFFGGQGANRKLYFIDNQLLFLPQENDIASS